jgi:hypothetical protein
MPHYLTFIREYDVLLPPGASLTSTFLRIRSSISREAVSCEHLASLAHLDEVSLPSKPLSSLLTIQAQPRLASVYLADHLH